MNFITRTHALLSTRGRCGDDSDVAGRGYRYLHLNWLATALADDGVKWYDDYNYILCVTG